MKKTDEFLKPDQSYSDVLRISPFAFAKMVFWRDCGDTEVAAYATTKTHDPLLITDFRLIKQECTSIKFDLDTNDLAEDVERTLDDGLCPWQTHNILCHSHPGNSPNPSGPDEINFQKAFSHPDWAIMLIIAKDDSMYCRLKLNTGPGVEKLLNVQIDFSQDFQASDRMTWKTEYESKVTREIVQVNGTVGIFPKPDDPLWWGIDDERWAGSHHVQQKETELEELECWWNVDGDAQYWDEDTGTWYTYDPIGQQWYIDEDDEKVTKIEIPEKPWTKKVVAWCERFNKERDALMKNQCLEEEEVEVNELI